MLYFHIRLMTEFDEHNSVVINQAGCYQTVCVELELDGLAVNTLLQAHHVHDIEGTTATVAFDTLPQASLEEMMGNTPAPSLASYDETALCSGAFRVLRSMVSAWLRDVSVHRNVMADYQLINFYRFVKKIVLFKDFCCTILQFLNNTFFLFAMQMAAVSTFFTV